MIALIELTESYRSHVCKPCCPVRHWSCLCLEDVPTGALSSAGGNIYHHNCSGLYFPLHCDDFLDEFAGGSTYSILPRCILEHAGLGLVRHVSQVSHVSHSVNRADVDRFSQLTYICLHNFTSIYVALSMNQLRAGLRTVKPCQRHGCHNRKRVPQWARFIQIMAFAARINTNILLVKQS